MGQWDSDTLSEGRCPPNNQLRYIHIPQGAKATLFDGEHFNGMSHQVDSGSYNVSPNWVSSMIVQPA